MKTMIDTTKTSNPTLAKAVIETVGEDYVEDLARHGAYGGFPGITYYSDTLAFFKANRDEIMRLAEETADSMGEEMLAMIGNFGCLKDAKLSPWEIAKALTSDGEDDNATQVQNAMTWFACEEMARQLCPDI